MLTTHPNFRHICTLLAIVFFLFGFSTLFTAKTFAATGVNRQINFQGRLVNNTTGLNVSNGSYSVVFTLYNNGTAGQGTALWTETQNVTATDGIFRVTLGSVTAIPANFNFNWDGLYLGIKVGTDAEMTPRIQMAAVPFAFNAARVAGLTVQDTSGNASTSATLQIGTSGISPITVNLGANNLTFTTSGTTSLTLPTGGTLLTNAATAVQTVTSTQTTGTVLGVTDSTGLTGAITGLNITLSGTGAQNQSGLTFNLTGASGTTLNDITGTAGWSVTRAGALTVQSCAGCGGGGVNYWGLSNGLLYNGNLTTDFVIGGTSTSSAKFLISQNGTMPTASVSAKTSFAGLVVDQAGVGDIFTASAAGATRFRIAQNGSILMQGQTIASVGVGGTNTTSGSVINAVGDQGSLVPNAGFESNMSGIGLSDGWVAAASNGATQVISRVATTSAKGISSIQVKLNASQSTAFYSTCIPLALSVAANYNLNFYVKTSSVSRVVRGYLDGYTSQANCQSNTSPVFSTALASGTTSTTAWYSYGSAGTAIAVLTGSQTWGRVHIFVGCPASCSTGTIVNIDGVRLIETSNAVGLDYAEYYPADPNNIPQAGDVVSVQSASGSAQVVPSSQFMDNSVIGVISTNPGQVLDDSSVPDPKVIVALAGRTPVKVSSKNGPIQIGDYLASSDIPGVAVKAITAGPVIGVAMEDYTDPDPQSIGKVVVFIKNTYFNGVSIASSSGLNLNGKDASVILAMIKDSANFSNSISLSLTKDGQFAIKDGNGNSVITFDNQGNAFFKGLIVADKIKANQIEGLDIFTNRISALEAKTAVLSDATGSAELATASASLPPALTLTSLSVDGLATVSGDLNVQNNSLIQGALTVLSNITTQNLLVSQFAYFINDVVFKGNVRFNSPPTFNSDTAGFAIIKKDSDNVQVAFTQEYADTPVVTASIALNKLGDDVAQKQLEDVVLNGNLSFILTQRTTKGFVIKLNKAAPVDISFSWVALSVKDAKTSGQENTPTVAPEPPATQSAAFQSIINQLNNAPVSGGGG